MLRYLHTRSQLLLTVISILVISFYWLGLTGCTDRYDYYQLVESELSKGTRNDSLFLGVGFGMTSDQFYDHITELGHKGIVSQGGGMTVHYSIEGSDNPMDMNFFPEYLNDSIYEIRSSLSYQKWAPWNKRTKGKLLVSDVRLLIQDWYGCDFMEIKSEVHDAVAYVNVTGNRRISIYPRSEREVLLIFTDLSKISNQ